MKVKLIIIMFVISTSLFSQENLLSVNPGFESGTRKAWSFSGENYQERFTVSKQAAFEGNYGLYLNSKNAAMSLFSRPEEGENFSIESGKKYRLEMMVKTINHGNGMFLRVYPNNRSVQEQDIFVHQNTRKLPKNEWTKMTFEFKGNENFQAKFSLNINNGEYYFDNFLLYEL